MIDKKNGKNNELIKKRRRKKRIKRLLIFFIFLISLSVILCLKIPYFNISSITVDNNKIVDEDYIIKNSGIVKGSNIFCVNEKSIKAKIEKNPYVSDVNIRRELPDKIIIDVDERQPAYYTMFSNQYYIIDNKGIVLEKKDTIKGMSLIFIKGVSEKDCILGKSIFTINSREINVISEVASLIPRLSSPIKITAIDVSDILNINIYFSNMYVKIGDDQNIQSKINKGINVILGNSLKDAKGYVDVSFKGNPVYHIEK